MALAPRLRVQQHWGATAAVVAACPELAAPPTGAKPMDSRAVVLTSRTIATASRCATCERLARLYTS
eukprot:11156023-Lingulodinium_polyedra.AAC.1